MLKNINTSNPLEKTLAGFTRNIIIVFFGASLVSFLNLLYQLLIAHKLPASEFAAFSSLLSIFMIVSSPLSTIQMAVAKYSTEFYAHNQITKLKFFLSDLIKKTSILAISTLLIFWFISIYIMNLLRIESRVSGYILAVLLASTWLTPVLAGGVQGLELFWWFASAQVLSGVLKLALAVTLILLGYNIAGALGALLVSSLVGILIFYFPLRQFISLKAIKEDIKYKEVFIYLFPVAISYFCFMNLVNFDMILVKYYFSPHDSGLYSLAQMVGKIFLFLPGAISIAMFPRTCGLNAKNMDTVATLKRSLLYAVLLCIIAILIYNIFPPFVLKILTGKVFSESIILGRLFSVSMSFFSLLFILTTYFLSLKDLRFIKYLVLFTLLQFIAIVLFHKSLIQVQIILCINAILLFCIHLSLVNFRKLEKGLSPKGTVPIL